MKTEHQKWKEKAWHEFSIFVRHRDKRCVTCGTSFYENGEYSIKGLQAGHYHHNVLDFCELNVHAQCAQCNKYLNGNARAYALFLVKKYGKTILDKLEKMKQSDKLIHHDKEWYQSKYNFYKEKNACK